MISVTKSGKREKENQYLLKYRESLKPQQLRWNWKLRKRIGRKCYKGKSSNSTTSQHESCSYRQERITAGRSFKASQPSISYRMSQEWNIPCCRARFQNISIAQSSPGVCRSKLTAGVLLCWTSLLLPPVSHSAPLYHLSITQHLSAIYQPCFLPSSFLKTLAKGCKYPWSVLTGIGTWHSSPLPALNYQTSNYYRSKWQKTPCI